MRTSIKSIWMCAAIAVMVAGCGSSGGSSTPPTPPAPVTPPPPPPPPPEPTFEQRLADWAEMDPNPCRARTPGFEALGGWLKDDGRELGDSKVWIRDDGALSDAASHGAQVWRTLTDCSARDVVEGQYFNHMTPEFFQAQREDGRDLLESISSSPTWEDVEFPEPLESWGTTYAYLDGTRDGQRILLIRGAGNDPQNRRTGELQSARFQRALVEKVTALFIVVGGYVGEGDAREPASSSSTCGAADPLCLFAPWRGPTGTGTSFSAPQAAAALDTVWAVWPEMDILDLRNLAFDCADGVAIENNLLLYKGLFLPRIIQTHAVPTRSSGTKLRMQNPHT